jgi:hypothetical protein
MYLDGLMIISFADHQDPKKVVHFVLELLAQLSLELLAQFDPD